MDFNTLQQHGLSYKIKNRRTVNSLCTCYPIVPSPYSFWKKKDCFLW